MLVVLPLPRNLLRVFVILSGIFVVFFDLLPCIQLKSCRVFGKPSLPPFYMYAFTFRWPWRKWLTWGPRALALSGWLLLIWCYSFSSCFSLQMRLLRGVLLHSVVGDLVFESTINRGLWCCISRLSCSSVQYLYWPPLLVVVQSSWYSLTIFPSHFSFGSRDSVFSLRYFCSLVVVRYCILWSGMLDTRMAVLMSLKFPNDKVSPHNMVRNHLFYLLYSMSVKWAWKRRAFGVS